MTANERAAHIWPILALATRNRHMLTYDPVARLTGVARVGLWLSLFALGAHSHSVRGQDRKGDTAVKETAQDQPIPRRNYVASGCISELVLVPAICKELKISSDQRQVILDAKLRTVTVGEIGQIRTSLRNARLDLQRALQSRDQQQFANAQRALSTATNRQARATEACDETVRALLTPAQNKRLVQIMLRQEGIRAVIRPDVAESVGMTREQVAQFHGLLAEREAQFEASQAAERDTSEAQARLVEWTRVIRKHQNHEALNAGDLRVLAQSNERAQLNGQKLDQFEQTTDALLTKILTAPQQQRLTALFGPMFDLGRLARKSQPKPERKQASPGDGKRNANGPQESAPPPKVPSTSATPP